jgi:hypothetical protein
MVPEWVQRAIFHPLKEIGMVAALTKLHEDVQDGSLARACILASDGLDVTKEKPFVQLLLHH